MKTLETEINIKASPTTVWDILIEFEKYPDWNPFVKSITGDVQVGSKFKALLQQPEGKKMTFKPKCLTFTENKSFSWLGHLLFPGLFDGEHIFEIHEIAENEVRFVQKENFKGILVGMFWKQLNSQTRKGFEMMNQALKERAEAQA